MSRFTLSRRSFLRGAAGVALRCVPRLRGGRLLPRHADRVAAAPACGATPAPAGRAAALCSGYDRDRRDGTQLGTNPLPRDATGKVI